MKKKKNFIFRYASINISRKTNDSRTYSQILKEALHVLSGNKGQAFDRYKNRKNEEQRVLLNISLRPGKKGLQYIGRMGKILSKDLMQWDKIKDSLSEINKPENINFVQVNHYIVDFTGEKPIIMFEYKSEGVGLLDLEYFFRRVLMDNKIANGVQFIPHLNTSYDDLEQKLRNIFKITVKVKNELIQDDWYKSIKEMHKEIGYSDVEFAMNFDKVKTNDGRTKVNVKGNEYARNIVQWLRRNRDHIKKLETLKMQYENDEGAVRLLDFIRNKTLSKIDIELADNKYDGKVLKEFMLHHLNEYITTGKTNHSEREE